MTSVTGVPALGQQSGDFCSTETTVAERATWKEEQAKRRAVCQHNQRIPEQWNHAGKLKQKLEKAVLEAW